MDEMRTARGNWEKAERLPSGTKRGIKSRHAQMIALGGSIGTGFFLSTGEALFVGGPAFLLLAFALSSILVYGILTAIVEIGVYLPVEGASMAYYVSRMLSRSLGFALGWLYFYSFGILVAFEITAAAIIIDYWPNDVPLAAWITILLVVIIVLNMSPVAVYAESEFWFAGLKIMLIVGLLIVSLVIMLGGGPSHDRMGFRYWDHPGAAKAYIIPGARGRFTAFLYTWIFSGISFYFTPEAIIFTVGEMRRPRKNLPIAARRFFFRLVLFYVLGVVAIGAICSSNATGLTNQSGSIKASPFVIGIREAGISVLPSIVNAGVLVSAWSAGNACLYLSSRSLYSLAVSGNAPRLFLRCTRYGLPIYCVAASSVFSLLAYLNVTTSAGVAFNWFISLTNTAGFTSWIVCCVCFLRFKQAIKARAIKMPYSAWIQPYAAWICAFIFTILCLCNGFTVFYPGNFTASGFLTAYIGIPAFLLLWFGHKFIAAKQDPWFVSTESMDLTTDVPEIEADEEMWCAEDAAQKDRQGVLWMDRILRFSGMGH